MNTIDSFICQILAIVMLTFTYQLSAQEALTPVQKHGSLQTAGNRIINQYGVSPQLRGISFSWSIWEGKKYYNNDVVDWLVDDFKVSLIRQSMAIEPKEGYLQKPEEQTALMCKVADRAIKLGIYVIIDWHDHHADRNREQAKAFFTQMAQLYAGTPNIIYEIWNEPERQTWSVIKAYALEVIEEIRKYDPDNLIVVGTPHWDQDVDIAAQDPITDYTNIAYSLHFYASDPYHQENLRHKANTALELGIPLFVTEWGVGESDGDGMFDREKTDSWMTWMEERQLSWANWNLTDKKETTAILLPDAPTMGNWGTGHLTEAGTYIREQLRKLNDR
ncbi:glycoside hydrolase family 5 protein [Parapedobacter tibetensis]|uniref:glycoside hydrolase family 5 protein n=1 Tax=Parapedobacter tibetensis TaxID=2972951 RepID=UPI00214D9565|nr:glycoside hydrolase family 5 protein [Parapedobacter tibetensis]